MKYKLESRLLGEISIISDRQMIPHLWQKGKRNQRSNCQHSLDHRENWEIPEKHLPLFHCGEGNGTPLQYSCLENPMDGGAWKAVVHGVAEGQTQLSDFTFTFHFHALEKEMATHSSVLAWRIPGMQEPGWLLSMGSHRVGHDWSDLAAAATGSTEQPIIITPCTSGLTDFYCTLYFLDSLLPLILPQTYIESWCLYLCNEN